MTHLLIEVVGSGVVVYDPHRTIISCSFRLYFPCSNNEYEYEALIIGLISILQLGIHTLRVEGDSRLIIQNVNGELALKEVSPVSYCTAAQKLGKFFSNIQFEHVPRARIKRRFLSHFVCIPNFVGHFFIAQVEDIQFNLG